MWVRHAALQYSSRARCQRWTIHDIPLFLTCHGTLDESCRSHLLWLFVCAFRHRPARKPACSIETSMASCGRRPGRQYRAVRALLGQGGNPDSRNRWATLRSNTAARTGNLAMAQSLISGGGERQPAESRRRHATDERRIFRPHGVSPAAAAPPRRARPVDRVRKTAAIYAAGNGHTEALAALLDAGIVVNARHANDATLLMWAAAYGREETVRMLLDRGADSSARDDRGKTALVHRREQDHAGVAAC